MTESAACVSCSPWRNALWNSGCPTPLRWSQICFSAHSRLSPHPSPALSPPRTVRVHFIQQFFSGFLYPYWLTPFPPFCGLSQYMPPFSVLELGLRGLDLPPAVGRPSYAAPQAAHIGTPWTHWLPLWTALVPGLVPQQFLGCPCPITLSHSRSGGRPAVQLPNGRRRKNFQMARVDSRTSHYPALSGGRPAAQLPNGRGLDHSFNSFIRSSFSHQFATHFIYIHWLTPSPQLIGLSPFLLPLSELWVFQFWARTVVFL